jgi:hypothetical protein
MRINITVSRYDIVATDFSIESHTVTVERYCRWKDKKYLAFLKAHGFDRSEKYFTLYLDLCAAGLL